jgi:hypothetical protein
MQRKLAFKVNLTRLLYKKRWSKDRILHLYRFLEGLLVLPKELDMVYHEEVKKLEGEFKVSYLTTAKRIGLEKGKLLGESNILLILLESKFKNIPNEYKSLVKQANTDSLTLWCQRILTAQKIDDVFAT